MEYKENSAQRYCLLAALVAVIGFSFVSCGQEESLGSRVTVSGSSLAQKIAWVQNHRSSGTTYILEVSADEELSGYELTSGSNKNMTIILNGNGKTISLKDDVKKWLFFVGDYITLELNDITLKGRSNNGTLVLVAGKLVMNGESKIIDNEDGGYGGVWVYPQGIFTMNGGEISGNRGGGVYVGRSGTFTMNGGTISGNTGNGVPINGIIKAGSGVESDGTFTMNGGEISGNTGGGVINHRTFTMNGGEISGNTGSGVENRKTFTMTNGTISGNTGNGVNNVGNYIGNIPGTFTMNGGEISGNSGGVTVGNGATFIMTNGKISGNTRSGVLVSGHSEWIFNGHTEGGYGKFTMSGGEISDNTDTGANGGGGVYVSGGIFTMSGGKIFGNTASRSGGGVFVSGSAYYGYGISTMSGGEIFGNTALRGGGVYVELADAFRITNGTIYGSNETAVDPETGVDLKNTADAGAALGLYSGGGSYNGSAQYGTYSGDTWNSNGNLSATDNTIENYNQF